MLAMAIYAIIATLLVAGGMIFGLWLKDRKNK